MRIFQLVIYALLLLATNCSETIQTLPSDARIITKYKVFDEDISPAYALCGDEVKPYREMAANDCSFSLGNFEFDIIQKFVLDSLGGPVEYWMYKSEGPLIYSTDDLESDTALYELVKNNTSNVRPLASGTHIIDTGDTLMIENVFVDEHLILVRRSQVMMDKGLRIIYEYK